MIWVVSRRYYRRHHLVLEMSVAKAKGRSDIDISRCLRLLRSSNMTDDIRRIRARMLRYNIAHNKRAKWHRKWIASFHVRVNTMRCLRKRWLSSSFRFSEIPRANITYVRRRWSIGNETWKSVASTNSPKRPSFELLPPAFFFRHILLQIDPSPVDLLFSRFPRLTSVATCRRLFLRGHQKFIK